MTVVPTWAYDVARDGLLLIAAGLLVLALFTPWRRPGGLPHREHIGLCLIGVLGLNGLLGRQSDADAYAWVALLTAIFCVFAVRSYRTRCAEVTLESAATPTATSVRGGA